MCRSGITEALAWRRRRHLVQVGPLLIDLATRTASSGRRHEIQLSPKDHRSPQVLALHAGTVVADPQLLKEVWGAGHRTIPIIRAFVRKSRHKIEQSPTQPRHSVTELGVDIDSHRTRSGKSFAGGWRAR